MLMIQGIVNAIKPFSLDLSEKILLKVVLILTFLLFFYGYFNWNFVWVESNPHHFRCYTSEYFNFLWYVFSMPNKAHIVSLVLWIVHYVRNEIKHMSKCIICDPICRKHIKVYI